MLRRGSRRFLHEKFIDIYVGQDNTKFQIHRHLLQANSCILQYFDTDDTACQLPSFNVDIFRYYVHWLYTKDLVGYHNSGMSAGELELFPLVRSLAEAAWNGEDSGRRFNTRYNARENEGKAFVRCFPLAQLIGLYILASQLQVRGLKDQIVTKIIRVYGKNIHARAYYWGQCSKRIGAVDADAISAMNLAYHNPQGYSLRPLLVRLYVENVIIDHNSTIYKYHPGFLGDVIVRLRRSSNPGWAVPPLRICEWHDHDDGPCSVQDGDDSDDGFNETPGLPRSWVNSPINEGDISTDITDSPGEAE